MIVFMLTDPTPIRTIPSAFAASDIPIKRCVKLISILQYNITEEVVKAVVVGFVIERE